MDKLTTASVKRLVVMLLSVVGLALQKKLGLELDATTQATIAGIVVAYLVQSGFTKAEPEASKTEQPVGKP
jgi:uncharacterized oligopeptide transporter (OPT) family protein